jgi:hypothetical protein
MSLMASKKLGQGLSIIGWLTSSNNIGDASIPVSSFVNANMQADQNNKYRVISTVFGVRRQKEYIIAYPGRRLLKVKNRYVFIE